jgi:hypothetical protein
VLGRALNVFGNKLPSVQRALFEQHHRHAALAIAELNDLFDNRYVELQRTPQVFGINTIEHHDRAQPTRDEIRKYPDDVLVSVYVVGATTDFVDYEKRHTKQWKAFHRAHNARRWVERLRLPFTAADVDLMLQYGLSHIDPLYGACTALAPSVGAALRLSAEDRETLRPLLEKALKEVGASRTDATYDRTPLRKKLVEMLAPAAGSGAVALTIFDDDGWGRAMRAAVPELFHGAGGLNILLKEFSRATGGKPTKKWSSAVERLVREDKQAVAFVRLMLSKTLDTQPHQALVGDRGRGTLQPNRTWELGDPNSILLRGAVWSTLFIDQPWRVDLVEAATRTMVDMGRSQKVANAGFYILGEIADDSAISALNRFRTEITDRSLLKPLEAALGAAAAKAGVKKWQLRERSVAGVDLDADGTKRYEIGGATVTARLEASGVVTQSWVTADGKRQASVPKAVRESSKIELNELTRAVKALKDALKLERRRMEDLFADNARWTLNEWRARYVEHPLGSVMARSLIWTFETPDGDAVSGLPVGAGQLIGHDGETFTPPESSEVVLWHPIHSLVEETAAWRTLLFERQVSQPFKQAFREVYFVAPAEEETGDHSNRFAAHILRYPQAYALMKSRGWIARALGPYDNDGGANRREWETAGITAVFQMEHANQDDWGEESLAPFTVTDRTRFFRTGEKEPMPVTEAPPMVFSETMRDIDMFVSIASIANDPEWIDRGDRRYDAYWHGAAFGDLNPTAETRRAALERLLPMLKIAPRCTLREKWLEVRGELRTYKIHLGTGNIMMEPNDQYLCIVPDRRGLTSSKSVYLPFDEDPVMTIILSKAMMLAEDTKIKDPTITAQIARR